MSHNQASKLLERQSQARYNSLSMKKRYNKVSNINSLDSVPNIKIHIGFNNSYLEIAILAVFRKELSQQIDNLAHLIQSNRRRNQTI